MFPFVLCEISACVLLHASVLPYRSTPSLPAILPESPFVRVLNHSWMHLFFVKEIFLTRYSLFPCSTLISGTVLIQFELRREKFVYSFCSAESHLTASCAHKHNLISAQADCSLKMLCALFCSQYNVLPKRWRCGFWLARVIPYTRRSI